MSESTCNAPIPQLMSLCAHYRECGDEAAAEVLFEQAQYAARSGAAGSTETEPAPDQRSAEPCRPDQPPQTEAEAERFERSWTDYALSAFLCLYISSIALVLMPSSTWRDALIKPVEPFVGGLGFWQAWNVFAPDIRKENFHITCQISFADGSVQIWEFPRQEKLQGLEKARAERYRKWANGHIPYATYSFMLPDTARYIAQLHKNEQNPPSRITFTYHSAMIPPPSAGNAALPEHTQHRVLFTYMVHAEDLR